MARPERTCIGCRRIADPQLLQRVSRSTDGSLLVGTGHPGRGAWLCSGSRSCFDEAVKRDAFRRALRAPVNRAALDRLRAALFDSQEP